MTITTASDLAAAVRDLRGDALLAGIDITTEHVRDAMHARGLTRYEDLTGEDLAAIADDAVSLAAEADD